MPCQELSISAVLVSQIGSYNDDCNGEHLSSIMPCHFNFSAPLTTKQIKPLLHHFILHFHLPILQSTSLSHATNTLSYHFSHSSKAYYNVIYIPTSNFIRNCWGCNKLNGHNLDRIARSIYKRSLLWFISVQRKRRKVKSNSYIMKNY